MYRLGAQGRAVQQRLQQQPYASKHEFQTPISSAQNDVNLLLSILKTPGNLNSTNLLSYMVHYIPKVKNEQNLRLIVDAFLTNKVIFPENIIKIDETYMIIEAIKATLDSKLIISEPSLPITKFYHVFVDSIFQSLAPNWTKILVITGILLTKPLYESHSIPETKSYFNSIYQSLTNLNHELIIKHLGNPAISSFEINTLIVISLACSLPFFNQHQKHHLPHETITHIVIPLLFQSPLGLSGVPVHELINSKSPVIRHLNRLSFLLENCMINGLSFGNIDSSLKIILEFSKDLHKRSIDSVQSWDGLKNILFGLVIIFQGYVSYSLNLNNKLTPNEYSQFSGLILKTLFHLNYIVEKIGTGGFQAYNFVYITSLDAMIQYSLPKANELGIQFTKELNLGSVNHYEISKTLFTLTFFETLSQHTSIDYYDSIITPIVDYVIHTTTHSKSLIEAAHSVIISTYIPKNSHIIASSSINYLHTVLSQFPILLSSTQLKIAIETIARAVSPPSEAYHLNKDNLRELLHTLYLTILNTKPGLPLQISTILNENGQQEEQTQPGSIRSALITALISTLPYLPPQILSNWLSNIWELIEMNDPIEFKFCEEKLWEMISEGFDMQRGNVGIEWWYNRGSINLENKL
ncbi:Peroxisomal biogenesis factor 8 [Wickerhamomyces ciferrii]|uniref:Peroxisomal biogenesis factor 8 n=1 Tax=Wickerhamomyces ciferrii (strain ATCC 14091 / BCRC 22168 / CBS 111 / JCM 3599 / NBRC 0793 / NRRL Y-1031 F-60-10) TaxID=1206466 RepID=K0KKI5_WICCF|nr:Peroxisomal biogenesis factor 8 [Wickerhamomyces ciferrii]CCH41979.1 Peroxisomal biogenesis factor 8 [Wickerhamomyces ciferrii]